MNDKPEHHIEVTVKTAYIEEQSAPEDERYVFAYTITLNNDGKVAARLLSRHWLITNAEGKTQEVRGAGVVGEHPYLQPGEHYTYTSGTLLETPVGTMEGSYQMLGDDGEKFDAEVPAFTLSIPHSLH